MDLWFQREKYPHGGELRQKAADRIVRTLISSAAGTKEREQTGDRKGFKFSRPDSSGIVPPARSCLQNLPKGHHQLETKVFRYPSLWGHFLFKLPQGPCLKRK